MCFVWIWEQTAIISLYSINWLVIITDTECVYCAVRAENLNVIQVNPSFERVKYSLSFLVFSNEIQIDIASQDAIESDWSKE
jgi:hypothetical protein